MESIQQSFNGTANFGERVSCTIARNGDLIHKVYVQTTLPNVTLTTGKFRWLNWLGHILIKQVEIEIGGQLIDRQYGEWLHIWNELSQKPGLKEGYANMVGNVPRLTQFVAQNTNNDPNVTHSDTSTTVLCLKLHFIYLSILVL